MTQNPARADVPAGALELLGEKGGAERALTAALASFQEQVQAVPSLDLAAVVEAARPAFALGIAFSSQLVDIRGRHKLRVTVMHAGGAEVSSEEWADEADDPLQASGWMLAMLLGIPLAKQAMHVEPEVTSAAELASPGVQRPALPAKASAPEASEPCGGTGGGDVALEPLTAQEIEATHQRILALPQAARRELTTAFREHFQVPRNARSIGDRITPAPAQRLHRPLSRGVRRRSGSRRAMSKPRRYGEQPRSLAGRHVIQTQVRTDVYLQVRELMEARNLSASGAVHHLLRERLGLPPLAPFDQPLASTVHPESTHG